MNRLEPLYVAEQIMKAIEALGKEGQRLENDKLIEAKANAMGEYDKALGVAVAALKLEGESISIIDKVEKGRCADLLIKKIVAEEVLKSHYSKLERLEAMLNGLQSANRYLSVIDTRTD